MTEVHRTVHAVLTYRTAFMSDQISDTLLQLYQPLHTTFEPRKEQIEVLRSLSKGTDVVLIARCGWGKSLIFQAFSLLSAQQKTITIIISPLKAVEHDQCGDTKKLHGARPCVLNGDNHTPELRGLIAQGHYTHVWMSPEIALGKDMLLVYQSDIFRTRIKLLAVDELHCVASDQWGLFRADFQLLGTLRARLPDGVVCFGTTATLTPDAWKEIQGCIGFQATTHTIRTPIDRPTVFLFVQAVSNMAEMEHRIILFALASYRQLNNIMPKIIFYVRTVAMTSNLRQAIIRWLVKAGVGKQSALSMVREYHGQLTETTRQEVFQGFMKGQYRILCATTAFGFGVNPPDVSIIVQEGRIGPVEAWQKGGRAARSIPNGFFFYLGERRLRLVPINKPLGQVQDIQTIQSRKRKAYQLIGLQLPPAKKQKTSLLDQLLPREAEFWNNYKLCARAWILNNFAQVPQQSPNEYCCNHCSPRHLRLPEIEKPVNSLAYTPYQPNAHLIKIALQFLRKQFAARDAFKKSRLATFTTDIGSYILPDTMIMKWITNLSTCLRDNHLLGWPWKELLGAEILELLWRCVGPQSAFFKTIKDTDTRLRTLALPTGDIKAALDHVNKTYTTMLQSLQTRVLQPVQVYMDPSNESQTPQITRTRSVIPNRMPESQPQITPVQSLPTGHIATRRTLVEIDANVMSPVEAPHRRRTRRGLVSVRKSNSCRIPVPANGLN